MRVFEKGLVLIAMLSILLRLMLVPGSTFFLALSSVVLACTYVVFSFALLNGIRLRDIFKKAAYAGVSASNILGAIFTGFALFLACLAIVFGILFWPGREIVLFFSFPPCLVVLIISIVKLPGAHRDFYVRILTRVPVAAALCLFLLLFPRKTLVEILFRDRPTLIEAINNAMDNPRDVELQKKKNEEFHKHR